MCWEPKEQKSEICGYFQDQTKLESPALRTEFSVLTALSIYIVCCNIFKNVFSLNFNFI